MKKIILGFAGEMASGKGTAAKYLAERYGGATYRFSTMLRDVLRRLHLPEDRDTLQKLSTWLRKTFGEDTMAKVMFEDAKGDTHAVVVIDGVRRLEDVKYLREIPEFKLCYLSAPMKTRHERLVLRGENADDKTKTFAQFEKDHEGEPEREITKLEAFATEVIDNSGTLPELYAHLDAIVKKYGE
ncbi:MAG: AAA family ATPase [bacterium]|nr:AAA family ATPase [bacterium]